MISQKTLKSAKIFSLKIFRLYGMSLYMMSLIYRADNNHDVVELQAKYELKAQPVGNDTSFTENKNENLQKNPAYQTAN